MPINMYLVKPNSTYEYDKEMPIAEADEFCGFPNFPSSAQLATLNWGEFYGD